jgi:DNA-binding NtrC family response regulator
MARLLIVDDGKNIRKHLATYFERRGHEVRTSGSAAEALSLVSSFCRNSGPAIRTSQLF